MKKIPGSLVLAGLWLPAACLAAPEAQPGTASPDGDAARPRQQQFAEAFDKADTDHDGVISRDEFAAMPRVKMLPEEKQAELFKRLDKDGNGSLSREELGRFGTPREGRYQLMLRLKELDKNGDGNITFEEFKASEFVKKLSPEKQQELFRRLDVNGDGVISPKDHPAGERPPGPPGMPRDPRHLFRILDKDGDGFLSFEELQQAFFVRNLPEAEQRAMFEKLDRNKDSKIDPEEFVAMHPDRKLDGKPEGRPEGKPEGRPEGRPDGKPEGKAPRPPEGPQ